MAIDLHDYIRSIKDFPIDGIDFKDITPLLKHPQAYKTAVQLLYDAIEEKNIDKVVCIESRGFFLGLLLADKVGAGFAPIRKAGKLPGETVQETYELEYGKDTLEIHKDAIDSGDNVVLHDDLLATGGTAKASCNLIEKLGGNIVHVSFLMELTFLKGRDNLKDYYVSSILKYN